jgi:hypothetical protein
MPRQNRSPEERSQVLEKANAKARKGYKRNPKKRNKVTDNEKVVITDMLVSLKLVGYNATQCSAIVGLSRGQVKEITNAPEFQARLLKLQEKLPEAAVTLGRAYLIEAVQAVAHVLRTTEDEALVLKAAAEMFDRFGIPKVSRSEVQADPIKPDSGDEIPHTVLEKLRTSSPEVQEQVAALQESFLEGVERILGGGEDGRTDEG